MLRIRIMLAPAALAALMPVQLSAGQIAEDRLGHAAVVIDADRDGVFSDAELARALEALKAAREDLADRQVRRGDAFFRAADGNGDGILSAAEIGAVREKLLNTGPRTARLADAALARLDEDGNGEVTREEFEAARPAR